jgi:hypothetical protein
MWSHLFTYGMLILIVKHIEEILLHLWFCADQSCCTDTRINENKVITQLPNSEQSYKGKVKTHNYINRQNQSTTGKLWKRNVPGLVQSHQISSALQIKIWKAVIWLTKQWSSEWEPLCQLHDLDVRPLGTN